MVRRRRENSTDGGLDSLMDAMTNVVGILVFVLIMTQLGVGDALGRIRERAQELPPVSAEEYEKMKQQADLLEKLIADARDAQSRIVLPDDLPQSISLEDLQKQMEEIRGKLDDISISDEKIAEYSAERDRLLKELAALQEKVAGNKGRRDDLKLEMDQLADVETPADINIRMPTPRPAPTKADGKPARPHVIMIKGGRAYLVDNDMLDAYKKIFEQLPVPEKTPTSSGHPTYKTAEKMLEAVNRKAKSRGRGKSIEYAVRIDGARKNMFLAPKLNPKKGRSLDTLRETGRDRTIQKWLTSIHGAQDYVHFHVYTPEMENYVMLREYADKLGVSAGWSFSPFEDHRFVRDKTSIYYLFRLGILNFDPSQRRGGGDGRKTGPSQID